MPSQTPPAATLNASMIEKPVTCGGLRLQPTYRRAYWREREVPLTSGEFRIVAELASNAGEDRTYRELYDAVRGPGFAAGSGPDGYRVNVRAFVKRIRRKFRGVDDDFDAIENFPGFGYRWRNSR